MPPNRLTGQQVQQVQDAILSGYSTLNGLRALVRIRLEAHLDEISTAGDLRTTVLDLIRWAEEQGRVGDLIQALETDNPNNPEIRQLGVDSRTWHLPIGGGSTPNSDGSSVAPQTAGRKLAGIFLAIVLVIVSIGVGIVLFRLIPAAPDAASVETEVVPATDTGPAVSSKHEDSATAGVETEPVTPTLVTTIATAVVQTAPTRVPTAVPAEALVDQMTTAAATQSPPTPMPPVPPPATSAGEVWINPVNKVTYVFVPAGEFLMGKGTWEYREPDDSSPQHTVYVDAFWIQQTEVTNAEYARCVEAGVCIAPRNRSWNVSERAAYPVTDVDWYDARDFAAWLGGRLPTEAEWEKACRGTEGAIYPWGNRDAASKFANWGYGATAAPVGTFPDGASPYGALDIAGNVAEWTSSLYVPYPYVADDGREDLDASGRRTVRGPGIDEITVGLKCTWRGVGWSPNSETNSIGFRVVVAPPNQ